MPSNPGILCYPNFNPNDLTGIKHALLLYDRVSVIAPTATPYFEVPLTPADHVKSGLGGIASYDNTDIKAEGALEGLRNDCRLEDGTFAVEFISDYEIAKSRATEFVQALKHDLVDSEVAAWEAGPRARHPDQDYAWYVSRRYFSEFPGFDVGDPDVRARFNLEFVADSRFSDLIKVPFLVGMSLGLSEALWAALDKDLSLFTLDRTSAEFSLLRLRRSWRLLSDDGALQDNLDIRLMKGFATSRFSAWTLGFRVPDLFRKIPGMSLTEVMDLRRQSDKMQALTDFRGGALRGSCRIAGSGERPTSTRFGKRQCTQRTPSLNPRSRPSTNVNSTSEPSSRPLIYLPQQRVSSATSQNSLSPAQGPP